MRPRLGINTCFAVKRWPRPQDWVPVVTDELGLDLVQHSLDLVDIDAPRDELAAQADAVRETCAAAGVTLHSTFTGLVAYSSSLLLHPDGAARQRAERQYGRMIAFSARAGAAAAGGHVGSLSVADHADPARRAARWAELHETLGRLRRVARSLGLDALLIENMACAREPATMAEVRDLLAEPSADDAAVRLCLDVGHQCVPGTTGAERDPYEWLRALGAGAGAIHLQQSDADGDHHWAFTAEHNAAGRIDAARVLDALEAGGAEEPVLLLEVIPSFEADDAQVLADLRESVAYWRSALGG
jgi:D-erythrulose 1-phosphate 3-epimerase